MIKLICFGLLALSSLLLFNAPWIAGVSYIGFSTLQPQHIWHWAFSGISFFELFAGVVLLAWLVKIIQKQIDWGIYKNKETISILVICLSLNLSNWFTPFIEYRAGISSDIILSTINVITIIYIIVLPLLLERQGLKLLTIVFFCCIGYYIYESNSNYFAGNWDKFVNSRYTGMDSGPYDDGNVYAILICMLYPFLFLTIKYTESKIIKLACLFSLPFLFNSLFLTGSRGALISILIATGAMALILKSKKLNLVLFALSIPLIIWQGGVMLDRTKSTIASYDSKNNIEEVNPRITTWLIGLELSAKYPLLGVGPQRFETARDFHFPNRAKTVAHNTYLALSSQSGVLSAIAVLVIIWRRVKTAFTIHEGSDEDPLIEYIIKASAISILIYAVGAIFLDMIVFEVFYFMVIANLAACQYQQRQLCESANE